MVKIIKIEEWMSKPVISTDKNKKVYDIVKLMDKHNIGVIPVVEGDKPIGIITERDILRRVVCHELNIHETNIEKIMTKNPVTVNHNASLLEVTRLMSKNNFRRLLVVKDGKLVGLITAKDIIGMMSA
ncbi:CBS domain-containing protein [Candidatus Woesearchaeota archaeon]|nr:CBS domain-containing protein [Candidatus Woesearchaeota archaeon]